MKSSSPCARSYPTTYDPSNVGYYTGCRKGEILALKWIQVDLSEHVVRLEPGTTKNEEARTIPLDGDLYETSQVSAASARLNAIRIVLGLFPRRRTNQQRLSGPWSAAAKLAATRSENPCKQPVGLREAATCEAVSRLAANGDSKPGSAGVPERIAMLISGHKSRSVFDRYNIVNERGHPGRRT